MLGEPGVIEAELVGAQDLAGDAGMHVAVRIGLGVDVGMGGEQDSEFHARRPFASRHHPTFAVDAPRRNAAPVLRDRGWLPAAAADMFVDRH